MRKDLFLSIIKRLEQQVPAVKYIDLWNEQIANITGSTFALPAVFVEFEPYQIQQQGRHVTDANIPIRLHIITRAQNYTGNRDERMAYALQYFDLIDDINRALVTLSGDNFTTLMHTLSATNHNHGELTESIEGYVCRAVDRSAQQTDKTQLVVCRITT